MNKLIYAGTITTGGDFNTAQTSGVYRYNGMPSNRPGTKENDYGIFYVMVTDSYVVQHAYSYLEQCWKHRATVINTYAWSDWKSEALKSDLLYKLTVKALGQTNTAHDVVINGTIDYQTYFLFGQKGLVCSANPMASGTPQFGGNIPEGFTIYQIGTDARKLYIAYPAYTSVYACSFYDFTITQKN